MAFRRTPKRPLLQPLQLDRLLMQVLNRPGQILIALAILTLVLGTLIPRLRFKTSVHDLVIETLPEAHIYSQFRNRFGSEELIQVVIRCEDVFAPTAFAQIANLSEAAGKIAGVSRVISLPVVKAAVDVSGSWSLERFSELIGKVPLFDRNLISADSRTTAITLVLANDATYPDVIAAVERLIAGAHDGLNLYQIGMPLVSQALGTLTQSDFLFLPPITAIIVALVLFLVLPLKRLVFLPLLCVGLALIWAFGLMGLWGLPLSLLTLIVPVFLIAVGTAYCLHILSAFSHHLEVCPTAKEAVLQTYLEMAPPTLLAVATTIIGLTSLLLNHITAIREFALFAVMGMFALLVMLLILLPAILLHLPLPAGKRQLPSFGSRFAAAISALVVGLNRSNGRPIHLIILAAVVPFCLLGMLRLRVETSPVAYFQEDTEIARNFKDIYTHLSGSFPANITVRGTGADFFEAPQNLKIIETLQTHLDTLPGVDKTISFVDYLKLVNYATNQYDAAYYVLPQEPFEIRMLINSYRSMLGKEMMTPFMVTDFSRANILLMTHFKRSGQFLELRRHIQRHVLANFSKDLEWTVTGLGLTLSASSRALTAGQIYSLGLTLMVVFVILALLCLSFKVALISLLPNIFPIVVTFGVMGWLGIELSMVTSLIASVAIGLAVDDTIHYLVRYNREIKKDLDKERAMAATLTHLVRPVVFTTVTIGLGFSVLTFSSFVPTAVFGLLMILTLFSALVGDLVILPTLLQRAELATLWDLVQIKLGKDPGNAIPLFSRLSRIQMHYALMAGVFKKLGPGQTLFAKGEDAQAMYLVMSGRLEVIAHDRRRKGDISYEVVKRVNRLAMGDVVGEMGMFRRSRRSATVIAREPTELLQISWQMIQRLELLHPLAARKLLHNLIHIVCDRLEATTDCLALESTRDNATGLYTSIGFRDVLSTAVARARRYNETLTLCLIGVDMAASAPQAFAPGPPPDLCRTLARELRSSDTFTPLDPTTFALLLPRTAGHKARTVYTRLQAVIDAFFEQCDSQPRGVHIAATHLDNPRVRSGGDMLQEVFATLSGLRAA